MRIRVIYFGMLKDAVGRQIDDVDLPEKATLGQLLLDRIRSTPVIDNFKTVLAFSINQEYAQLSNVLRDGDEVAMLPPVSGGCGLPLVAGQCLITRTRIEAQALIDSIKRPEDGAISIFDGIVRNNSRGRQTLYLDYEAYETMALKKMSQLSDEARSRFNVRQALIVHRLGRVEVGETSVLIVVGSAHRAATMDACRWLIDTLKKTVPIWKKEYFSDGAVWADGEPFPEDILPKQGLSVTGDKI